MSFLDGLGEFAKEAIKYTAQDIKSQTDQLQSYIDEFETYSDAKLVKEFKRLDKNSSNGKRKMCCARELKLRGLNPYTYKEDE